MRLHSLHKTGPATFIRSRTPSYSIPRSASGSEVRPGIRPATGSADKPPHPDGKEPHSHPIRRARTLSALTRIASSGRSASITPPEPETRADFRRASFFSIIFLGGRAGAASGVDFRLGVQSFPGHHRLLPHIQRNRPQRRFLPAQPFALECVARRIITSKDSAENRIIMLNSHRPKPHEGTENIRYASHGRGCRQRYRPFRAAPALLGNTAPTRSPIRRSGTAPPLRPLHAPKRCGPSTFRPSSNGKTCRNGRVPAGSFRSVRTPEKDQAPKLSYMIFSSGTPRLSSILVIEAVIMGGPQR